MSEGSNSGKVIIIVAIVVVILGGILGGWYWGMYLPEQEAKEQARLEQEAAEAEAEKRRQQAAQRKARYDKLISDGDAAFDQEDWVTAQSSYFQASSLLKNEQYPKSQLAIVNAELDKIAELEARRAAGIVETISSETGRFYVIISSSIDSDLAMDYATKLSKEGNSVKVVEHEADGWQYFGVSLADYSTWDEAASAIQSFSSFGQAWVLKN